MRIKIRNEKRTSNKSHVKISYMLHFGKGFFFVNIFVKVERLCLNNYYRLIPGILFFKFFIQKKYIILHVSIYTATCFGLKFKFFLIEFEA